MISQDCRYTREHEWVRIEGDLGVVGITHYAQDHLGDVVFVDLPSIGTAVEQMKPFGVVESVKAASDVFSPLSGQIVGVNTGDLLGHPELVNREPYGRGWMIKIKSRDLSELENLMTAEQYEAYLQSLQAAQPT